MFKAFTLVLANLAILSLAQTGVAEAQSYPVQAVHVYVGFPAGGPADVLTRLLAQELSSRLGEPVMVENRAGASGNIAVTAAAKAPADGYTLVVAAFAYATSPSLYPPQVTDSYRDLSAVVMMAATPYVLVVHPSMPATSVAELVTYLKQNPGKVEFASASPGTPQHLAGELFKKMAGVDIIHVPYKGSAAAQPDLLAGRVPMMFDNLVAVLPHIRKGALRPLAITTRQRLRLLPDVPTVSESGLPGFEVLGWFALMSPARTPPEIVKRLNLEVNEIIAQPAFQKRLAELGAEPLGGTPEESTNFIARETAKWGSVISEAGIRAE